MRRSHGVEQGEFHRRVVLLLGSMGEEIGWSPGKQVLGKGVRRKSQNRRGLRRRKRRAVLG